MRPSPAVSRRRLPVFLAVSCTLLLANEPRAEQASSIRDVTAAISKGADSTGRRQAIVDRLKAIGVEYKLEEFANKAGRAAGDEVDAVLSRRAQSAPPRVLTIIHTTRDVLDVLHVAEVEKGAQALERFLRLVDDGVAK